VKFRTMIGGALVGLRDYLVAEEIVIPKGLRGAGAPMQAEGWPPTVDAKFYVMARWLLLWIALAPVLVVGAIGWAVSELSSVVREEHDHTRRVVHHQEVLDAGKRRR